MKVFLTVVMCMYKLSSMIFFKSTPVTMAMILARLNLFLETEFLNTLKITWKIQITGLKLSVQQSSKLKQLWTQLNEREMNLRCGKYNADRRYLLKQLSPPLLVRYLHAKHPPSIPLHLQVFHLPSFQLYVDGSFSKTREINTRKARNNKMAGNLDSRSHVTSHVYKNNRHQAFLTGLVDLWADREKWLGSFGEQSWGDSGDSLEGNNILGNFPYMFGNSVSKIH